ncbi:MAG TPA: M28 family peptidase [Gemmatimonadaceae bacterium]|nr:M28 family peptidase [Gemmatimonadaceae bacterium]
MRRTLLGFLLGAGLLAPASSVAAQSAAPRDSVIARIRREAEQRSQLYPLAQTLLDSIGPRLVGSVEQRRANDWMLATYRRWGIPARSEQYGTWMEWRREIAHVDLIAPRTRSLDGVLSTWSPGTKGTIEAGVVVNPDVQTPAEFEAWLPRARGKLVLLSFPWPSCRADASWREFAGAEALARMQQERAAAMNAWYAGRRRSGVRGTALVQRLAEAGALGVVTLLVPPPGPAGWGVSKISTTISETIPEIGLGCEDYGLVYRLAERNQGPVLRVDAHAELRGIVPAANVIAELRGGEKRDEYVVLSAHLDSWDPASGATDNGSGTVLMMEVMRILKAVYPNPKRTIVAGHWNGEEQGFNGSGSFAADHPRVVAGLQALLNQDGGTGRIESISMEGFAGAGAFFRRWLAQIPEDVARNVRVADPGTPSHGTDHVSFACRGAPAFNLTARGWDYETYTWHTNRDTFDKLVFDDLTHNAMLVAMLAYLASEDPERVPRSPRVVPPDSRTGQPGVPAACRPPARSWAESAGG